MPINSDNFKRILTKTVCRLLLYCDVVVVYLSRVTFFYDKQIIVLIPNFDRFFFVLPRVFFSVTQNHRVVFKTNN